MSRILQPVGQIKLTNVSLVRLKKGKHRFEIACYKNKVMEWRSGIETDLDNVLQIPNVFLNVSKGQTAPRDQLDKAFGKGKSTDDIILEILKKGEMQVGEKERAAQIERVHNEVIALVAARLIDPRTKRVYTSGMIEKALDMLTSQAHTTTTTTTDEKKLLVKPSSSADSSTETDPTQPTLDTSDAQPSQPAPPPQHSWTGVVAHKNAKSQALDAMRALIAHQPIPIARARMRLRIACATNVLKQGLKHKQQPQQTKNEDGTTSTTTLGTVKDCILSYVEQIESQDVMGSEWELTGFVEPGALKPLSDFLANETRGQGRVEILDLAVTHED